MDIDILTRITEGLSVAAQPDAILWIAAGVVFGMLVGAAPGLGPTVGMAVMLPVAVRLSPEHALFFLMAIAAGTGFGNSIPAILVGIPGSPSALLTVIEGLPLHRRGEGGRALMVALWAVIVSQLFGVLMFIALVIPLAEFAVRLLFPEVFAIVVFGIVTATGLVTRSPWKGLAAIMIGLLLALPGTDAITGQVRLTFGWGYLQSGMPEIPVVVGLLAFREVFLSSEGGLSALPSSKTRVKPQWWLAKTDRRAIAIPIVVGTVIGVFVGIVPGAGSAVASFIGYQALKMVLTKHREWGKGSIPGVAVIEASGNGAIAGELIPTMALGIPGAPSMVVVMAALATQGIFAGPQLVQTRPDLLYAVFGGLLVAVVASAVFGYLSIPPSIYIANISPAGTVAATMILVVVGAFALRWSLADVWLCLASGLLAYFMTRYDYPVAPAALAFILGSMLETNLRRGLVMTQGWSGFLSRPLTATLLILALLAFIGGIYMNHRTAAKIDIGAEA
ncbi:MAG: hypothetical protein GEU73_13620 [Chloroflexi bacterium]|nr:hypothetical protein [Chloroflexota bacterium]